MNSACDDVPGVVKLLQLLPWILTLFLAEWLILKRNSPTENQFHVCNICESVVIIAEAEILVFSGRKISVKLRQLPCDYVGSNRHT